MFVRLCVCVCVCVHVGYTTGGLFGCELRSGDVQLCAIDGPSSCGVTPPYVSNLSCSGHEATVHECAFEENDDVCVLRKNRS